MTQRLFLLSPAVVFAARVNQSAFTYDLAQVTFDGVTTGAYTDILPGMTVLFGTSAGSDNRGRQRIRKAATSNALYFGRSSQGVRDGEVRLADNNYITVLNDYRVWAKIPDMDGETIYKDADIAYTDETDEIPPKANISLGAVAATIDGDDIITMNFNGAESYAVAPGATLTGYSWDVDDGTITAGADTSAITAEFPAGFRTVSLTVTDSNGKTHTTRVPVYADDPDDSDCVSFECLEHRITPDGQTAAFRILEDIPITTYPDGTLVIFWEGEPSNADVRDNVLFWGWVQTEDNAVTAERTATLKDVTLRCVDVAGRLATLPGFSQSIIGNTTPTSWLEMKSPNMDKFIDYLLRWHSTAFEVAFFKPSGTGSDFPFVILEIPGENLWEQARGRAKALVPDYILSCNRNGELKVWPDPMLQDTRTSTSQATLNEDDFTAVSWTRQRPPRVHWIWGSAIVASATTITAVFCTAPGQAPGQGEVSQQSGYQLTQSQDDLNACEGHRYAQFNAFNGLLLLRMTTDLGIDPADMTWVTFSMAASYTRRQLGFTSTRMLPLEVNISYEYFQTGMVRTVELSLQEETSGTAAVTYDPPETDWEPPYEPPIDPPDPPDDPTTEGDGFGTLFVRDAAVLKRTSNFGASSPVYSTMETAGVGEEFNDFIIDPYAFLPSDPSETVFLIGTEGIYRCTDMFAVSPTFTLIYDISDMETATGAGTGTIEHIHCIKGCIRKRGFFVFGAHERLSSQRGKTWIFYTNDSGDNWTAVLVHDGSAADGTHYQGTLEVSPHLSGSGNPVVYVGTGQWQTVFGDQRRIYRSDDGAANWTLKTTGLPMSTSVNGPIIDLHVPYDDNADSNIVYAACAGAADTMLGRSADGGANWSTITPESSITNGAGFKRTPFQTFTQDKAQIYAFGTQASTGDCRRFYLSTNNAASFTHQSTLPHNVRAAGGFPYNGSQFYLVTTNQILVSIDGGVNWINKTGNFGTITLVTVGANIGCTIVPVWVAE